MDVTFELTFNEFMQELVTLRQQKHHFHLPLK